MTEKSNGILASTYLSFYRGGNTDDFESDVPPFTIYTVPTGKFVVASLVMTNQFYDNAKIASRVSLSTTPSSHSISDMILYDEIVESQSGSRTFTRDGIIVEEGRSIVVSFKLSNIHPEEENYINIMLMGSLVDVPPEGLSSSISITSDTSSQNNTNQGTRV